MLYHLHKILFVNICIFYFCHKICHTTYTKTRYFFLVWFGVQFIRQGIYQGGVFRFTISLPQNFPDGKCPVCISIPLHIMYIYIL